MSFVQNKTSTPAFWLDAGENWAHTGLGIIALAAVFVPGLNSALAPYYRWIVILVGIVALFFAVYGFVQSNATYTASSIPDQPSWIYVVVLVLDLAPVIWWLVPAPDFNRLTSHAPARGGRTRAGLHAANITAHANTSAARTTAVRA